MELTKISKGIRSASFGITIAFAAPVVYKFGLKGLAGYLLAVFASFLYFAMLANRVAKVIPGKKGVAYMLRGLATRLLFIVLSGALLLKSGFEPLAVVPGILVVPAGNKLYALYIIFKGLKELRGGN